MLEIRERTGASHCRRQARALCTVRTGVHRGSSAFGSALFVAVHDVNGVRPCAHHTRFPECAYLHIALTVFPRANRVPGRSRLVSAKPHEEALSLPEEWYSSCTEGRRAPSCWLQSTAGAGLVREGQ